MLVSILHRMTGAALSIAGLAFPSERVAFLSPDVCLTLKHVIDGNVRNDGLIDNLPEGCCVEVPCLVDRAGVVRVGYPSHQMTPEDVAHDLRVLTSESA